jgi:hypothetical protein
VTDNIPIEPLFPEVDWDECKVHVAQTYANTERPIDAFTRSFDEWQHGWNGGFKSLNYWNRQYIFSIIDMPHKENCWLFGGIFKVVECIPGLREEDNKKGVIYQVALDLRGKSLIGRLIIRWKKHGRNMGRNPESMLHNMSIAEILPESYAGVDFPGYAHINHSYASLEMLWKENKPDWKAALRHCHGVYLITDVLTGMRYVGSAYGDDGIWSRWETYFKTGGHGDNKLLRKLLRANDADYARHNFQFSLLEQASSRDSEQQVMERESFWKQVLLTRGEFGLNEN